MALKEKEYIYFASTIYKPEFITGYAQTTASTTMLTLRQSDQCGVGPDLSDWVGDGYCDDETNSENCNYDGGDCCWDKGLEI